MGVTLLLEPSFAIECQAHEFALGEAFVGLVCRCNPMGAARRQTRPIHHHDDSVAAAIQWVLRKGKLDLYINMMILFSTPQKVPVDI